MTNPYMMKVGSQPATGGSFSGSYPSQQITDILSLGVGTVFYQIRWSLIDPNGTLNTSNYVWTAWDQAVSQCNQAGVDIILAVMFPPTNLQISSQGIATNSALNTFCAQIAHAYTAGDPGQRGTKHIKGIYLGNEDYDHGGSGGLPAQAASALATVYPTIKAINPSMLVIAPAKLQRNLTFYKSWFDALLNHSTGAWNGTTFCADALSFHYHSALPQDSNGVPISGDPRVDFNTGTYTIPSWETCWKTIQSKMAQYTTGGYNCTVPVYADENGEMINTNPGRSPGAVISDTLRSTYINYELEQARNSGVVTHYGIYTLAEFTYGAGSDDPGQRDGESLIQNNANGTPLYGPTFQMMQNYIKNLWPTWGATANPKALLALVHSKFTTKNTKSITRTRSKFYTKYSALKTTTQSVFKIQSIIRNLVALSRSTFKIQSISSVKNLLGQVFSKFLIYVPPHKVDLDYAHDTFSGSDGIDTFVGVDGNDGLNGIG